MDHKIICAIINKKPDSNASDIFLVTLLIVAKICVFSCILVAFSLCLLRLYQIQQRE